jgi:lactoylglutathione lyase
MIPHLKALEVITLFVRDLAAARTFYTQVFGWSVVYEDDVSVVMKLQNVMINLLKRSEAQELVTPLTLPVENAGTTMMLTMRVDNANDVCSELREHGVSLLNGPVDRPWGRRTAAFSDPDGNVWEVAQEL